MRKIISYLLMSIIVLNMVLTNNYVPKVNASQLETSMIESPVFNEDGTVTVNVLYEGETLFIIGNFDEASNWGNFIPMTNQGSYDVDGIAKNLFSYTFSVSSIIANRGEIQYKFSNVENWNGHNFIDPLNANYENGNSKIDYLKIILGDEQLQVGSKTSVKAIRIDNNGQEVDLTKETTFFVDYEDVTVTTGQVIVAETAEIGTQVTVEGNYKGVKASSTFTIIDEPLISPIVNQGSVTFNYQGNGNESKVALAGSFNGWSTDATLLEKTENNLWTKTLELSPGSYEYKFVVDGSWTQDPLNDQRAGDNSLVIVDGIRLQLPDEIALGDQIDLIASYIDKDGNSTYIDAEWSLKDSINGVTLTDNRLSVDSFATVGSSVTVVASYNGKVAEHSFSIIGQTYEFTIHYYRYDNNQMDWDLWVWMDGKEGVEYDFTELDIDGFATVTLTVPQPKINIITRPGNWSTQEMTRVIEVLEGDSVEVWIIEGDEKVYYTKQVVDTSAKVKAALMDSVSEITIFTTNDIGSDTSFKLKDSNGVVISTTMIKENERKATLILNDPQDIDVTEMYTVESDYFGECTVIMRGILDDKKYYYNGDDLGLSYSNEQSTFKVWAPTAKEVYVSIYDDAGSYNDKGKVSDHTNGMETLMIRQSNGLWEKTIFDNLEGKYYMYKVVFSDGTTNYAVDPYAKAVSANGQRAAIIDMSKTNPEDFSTDFKPPIINPTDAVIYELHVRDFSMSDNSRIINHGKYKAFTETGTSYNGVSTGIDSLEELGVTHVHLLPVYDYATVNELTVDDETSEDPKYNWGYDPQNYNVPEGSYSTDPQNPYVRIKEFKEMVQSLHDKNIGVVMDVVYNHTFSIEDSNFDKIVPGYYHRTDERGNFTNGSGCGNEIASERPMVSKYIVDSVVYWAEEYGIDGFRFDLMKLIDIKTIEKIEDKLLNKIDSSIIIYGEPWSGGATSLDKDLQIVKGTQKDRNFAVFNDNLRGAIKGGSDDGTKGFATGFIGNEDSIVLGVKGSIDDFTNSPTETINYVTAHDNLNLWDKIIKTQGLEEQEGFIDIKDGQLQGEDANTYSSVEEAVAAANPHSNVDKDNVLNNETVKRSILANGIVLTSQGIPFIHAGEEILRTKYGDHNSYRSPDAINMIRWEDKASFKEVFDYYQGLIELRKAHPAFRMTKKDDINSINFFMQEDGIVAYELKDYANNDTWNNIIVIYNANTDEKTIDLPANKKWNIVVNGNQAGTKIIESFMGDKIVVDGLSMYVLYDESIDYTPVETTLILSHEEIGLEVGDQQVISAIVKDQEGRIMDIDLSFISTNENIATINNDGLIKAISEGDTTIQVIAGTLTKEIVVHVGKRIPTTVTITGENTVYETYSIYLDAVIKDQYGQVMTWDNINWQSSDESIATVSQDGKVTGVLKGVVTITVKVGSITASKRIEVKENTTHYVRLYYEREDGIYDDWNLWVWNTGIKDGQIDYTKIENGKAVFDIEITPFTTQIGFIIRKGTDWSNAKQDIPNDRFINIFQNEIVTKVTALSMVQEIVYHKQINGPEINQGKATFYYRDPVLYANDQMDTIDRVVLNIFDNTYEMQYIPDNELYEYTFETVPEGEYEYTFDVTIDGNTSKKSDVYNLNPEGKSIFTYEKMDLFIQPSISKSSVDYNENTVLSLTIKENGVDVKAQQIIVDVSALGGESVYVDPSLNEVSLSIKDYVTAGIKEIPITVIDLYGGSHQAVINLEVLPRNMSNDDNIFDFDEARIYFMLTDRFNNGDSQNDDPYNIGYNKSDPGTYHGGDFKGIIEKLDYLDALGINTIWITPVVDNINYDVRFNEDPHITPYYGYHGYWADNFEKLNPHLGTLDDFHTLIDEAHKRNIKIMVDVVLNHAGYGLKEGDTSDVIPNYPTDDDRERFSGMLRENPTQGDPITGELAGLPDFKTEDELVRNKLIQWQVNWVKELGVTENGNTIDYFRVDTVKHVDDITWMAFKNELTRYFPEFKMIGESYGASPEDNFGDLGNGKMDALLDFSFNDVAKQFVDGDVEGVEQYLQERNDKLNNTYTFGQFLSSHDEDGFLTVVGNDKGKQKIAAALQITAKGQPVIYYGEELGLSGLSNYPYLENRYDIIWEQVENNDMLEHYTKLLNIRKDNSIVFSKGDRDEIVASNEEGYVVFERSYGEDKIIIGLNVKDSAKDLSIKVPFNSGTKVKDLYGDKIYTVDDDNNITLLLPSKSDGGTVILKEQKNNDGSNNNGSSTSPTEKNSSSSQDDEKVDAFKEREYLIKTTDEVNSIAVLEGLINVNITPNSFEGTHAKLVVTIVDQSVEDTEPFNNVDDKLEFITPIYEFDLKDLEDKKVSIKEPITIELKFDTEKVKDLRKIGVYYFNEESKIWEYVGGKVLSENIISFKARHFSKYTVMENNKSFEDIYNVLWAKDAIEVLASNYILDGVEVNKFEPNRGITKAEFVKILVEAFDLEKGDKYKTYKDVTSDEWYYDVVSIASSLGIVNGYEGYINPNKTITREEMAVMLYRTLSYLQLSNDNNNNNIEFNDEKIIAEWAKQSVEKLMSMGIIKGTPDGNFNPKNNLIRAEAAILIYRILY